RCSRRAIAFVVACCAASPEPRWGRILRVGIDIGSEANSSGDCWNRPDIRRNSLDCSYKRNIYSCFVKSSVPQLTPFVRSDAVGAILAESLGHPDREFSLAELGRLTGVSGPVVHREVGRLVE